MLSKENFKGNSKDNVKCNQALERYCTQLKELNNKTISGLCKDNTDSNPKKNDDQVRKELCLKLIAEVAEQCRLQRQVEITLKAKIKTTLQCAGQELEARALIWQQMLARYGKDCKEIEEVCKNIDKTCDGLKPLDIKSQEIVTQNVTTTTTKTVGPDGKTVSEQCKSIQTTDTWITRTSTHTSTDAKRGVEDDGWSVVKGVLLGNGYFNYDLEMGKHDLGKASCLLLVGQNLAGEVARAVKRRDPGVKKDEIDEGSHFGITFKKII
ncbi:hypothetical protein PMAC_003406 [Pneumocystis sp. 'macacae']|nr:hypothetical protein PMAC_003406 [Pneumocystis sp. 'macacae']